MSFGSTCILQFDWVDLERFLWFDVLGLGNMTQFSVVDVFVLERIFPLNGFVLGRIRRNI